MNLKPLSKAILGGFLAAMSCTAAHAATTVSDSVSGSNAWGIIQFDFTGGYLTFDVLADGWTGGKTGQGINDSFISLFFDDGSPLTAFGGSYIGSNDDAPTYYGFNHGYTDGSRSSRDSYMGADLAAGSYLLAISHSQAGRFFGNINYPSRIQAPYLDYQVWFSHDVTVTAINGTPVSTVPLPAALPLLGAGVATVAFVGRKKKQKNAA